MSATNPNVHTIGDALAAFVKAGADQASAQAAAAAADSALAAAQEATRTATAEFVADLAIVGSVYAPDPSNPGGIVVYVSDSGTPGYHVLKPAPISASVDATPPTPVAGPTPPTSGA